MTGMKFTARDILSTSVQSGKVGNLLEDAIQTMTFNDSHRLFVQGDDIGSLEGSYPAHAMHTSAFALPVAPERELPRPSSYISSGANLYSGLHFLDNIGGGNAEFLIYRSNCSGSAKTIHTNDATIFANKPFPAEFSRSLD